MTYYIKVKRKDRIGNVSYQAYIVDAKNKTEAKKRYNRDGMRVTDVYTEEELQGLTEKAVNYYKNGYDMR